MPKSVRSGAESPRGWRGPSRRAAVWAALVAAAAVVAALSFAVPRAGEREAGPSPVTVDRGRISLRTVFTPPTSPARRPSRFGDPGRVGTSRSGSAEPEFVPGRLVVKFEDETPASVARGVVAGVDGDVEARVDPLDIRVVDVAPADTRAALEELAASPAVEYVERDAAVQGFATPNDTLWREQWGPLVVDSPTAWDWATGSPTTVVAVLDTGVDSSHPDLEGAVVAGFDFVNGDADPADDNGHGTAAAGVIGARTNNGRGQAGICWRCSLMPVKVLDANGSGSTSIVAAGIVWAVDHGARVISLSLGGESPTHTLGEAVAYATGKGVVVVAAAGNSGNSNLNYPAAYEGVIGVAGTTPADGLYSWSNFGDWVLVAAPGCNVATYLNGDYVNFCGTSSAAPVVAGIAGLAVSGRPNASPGQVEDALLRSAATLGGSVRYGRVNAPLTLKALGVRATPAAAPAPAAPPASTTPAPAAAPPPPAPTTTPAPAAPAPAPRGVATFRGRLAQGAPLRLGVRRLAAGVVTATLTVPRERVLTLLLLDAKGQTVARASGRSPLRLSHTVAAGKYRFAVRGSRAARYTLAVTHGG